MQRLLNYFRKLNRRLEHSPHWFKDLYQLVSYVNFLELIPTFTAIALAPQHFFRRLPLILQRQRPIYRTPIKFFVNSAALFVAIFFVRHGDMGILFNESQAVWYMLLLIPIVPLFMIVLAAVLWAVYKLPLIIKPLVGDFPQPNPYPFFLTFSLKTYLRLDLQRFFWGLFYISIYFIISWQFAQLIMVYSQKAMNWILGVVTTEQGIVEFLLFIVLIVLTALVIHWLVFRPYGEMLKRSLRYPLPNVFKADVYDIKDFISEFIDKAKGEKVSDEDIESLCLVVEIPVDELARSKRFQDFDYRTVGDIDSIKAQRKEIYLQAFQIESMRQIASDLTHLTTESRNRFEALLSEFIRLADLNKDASDAK